MFGLFGNNVSYTLSVPVNNQKKLKLEFKNTWEKSSYPKGMNGYSYSFNGRKYTDVASLLGEKIRDISPDVTLHRDAWGEQALCAYTQIPTFDSGDREWDSKKLEILFFDGKEINMVVLRGGYKISKLIFYSGLQGADSRFQGLFGELGWPEDKLRWLE